MSSLHRSPSRDGESGDRAWNRFSDPVSEGLAAVLEDIGVGNRLPSERELSDTLGVSRTALRDRLQLLEAVGVIRRRQGSGTFVAPLDPSGLAFALNVMLSSAHLAFDELVGVRIGLEREAAIEAAQRIDPILLGRMEVQLQVIGASSDPWAVEEADWAFHQVLLEASGNRALAFLADALSHVQRRVLAERQDRWRRKAIPPHRLLEVHSAIHAALASRDSDAAARAVDEHFESFELLVNEREA